MCSIVNMFIVHMFGVCAHVVCMWCTCGVHDACAYVYVVCNVHVERMCCACGENVVCMCACVVCMCVCDVHLECIWCVECMLSV